MARRGNASVNAAIDRLIAAVTQERQEYAPPPPPVEDVSGKLDKTDATVKQDLPRLQVGRESEGMQIWLRELEKIFHTLSSGEVDKVTFAPYALSEGAGCWWEGTRRRLEIGGTTVTWTLCEGIVQTKSAPEDVREKGKMGPPMMTQNPMVVEEDTARLQQPPHFHHHGYDLRSKSPKVHKRGCNKKTTRVTRYGPQRHQEKVLERKMPYPSPLCSYESSLGHSMRPLAVEDSHRSTLPSLKCFRCGGPHYLRNCPRKFGTKICFKCNEAGHISRDCPDGKGQEMTMAETEAAKEGGFDGPRTTGRMSTMSSEETSCSGMEKKDLKMMKTVPMITEGLLKNQLTSISELNLSDLQIDFEVFCEASKQGLGRILM